ncbi:MAG: arylsulfotransferase family protein [Lysobacterales bacterium]|jgi:hypothetical protein
MNKVQKSALIYMVIVLLLAYGYAVGRFEVFPHAWIEKYVKDFQRFAAGDPLEKKSSVTDKLFSDLALTYARWAYAYPPLAVEGARPLNHPAFKKRDPPLYFVDDDNKAGYRVVIGAFDLAGGTFWGGILISPDSKIIHTWNFSTDHIKGAAPERLKNLYGVHVFPDGSVIFNMGKRSGGIVKVDACSNIVWTLHGDFHHTVSPDEHGNFWTFIGKSSTYDQDLALVSIETGKIVRRINMKDVRAANPDLHIWNLGGIGNIISGNMTHGNDIDPLPAAKAHEYPGLKAGDLVISYAATNLIFILDPDTLEVKWWRVGAGDFQHDPDWEPDGQIVLFSNNHRAEKTVSDIVDIDYATMRDHVILRGERYGFYSDANGRHQLTPYGTRMITSSRQGWAFEVDSTGKIVSSFVNNYNAKEALALHLSEAWRFDENYFKDKFWLKCGS